MKNLGGRPVKVLELDEESEEALKKLQKTSDSACVRQRCHTILLKSQGYSSLEIAKIVGFKNYQPVLRWIHRYEQQGIKGLMTKKGQGRPSILKDEDIKVVREKIQEERQRLKLEKVEIEQTLDKEFSIRTLTRFLKDLTEDGKE